jgi:hypothetical protein
MLSPGVKNYLANAADFHKGIQPTGGLESYPISYVMLDPLGVIYLCIFTYKFRLCVNSSGLPNQVYEELTTQSLL